MKQKYIEERYGFWFVFGKHRGSDLVDVSDGERDVVCAIPEEIAEYLIKQHNGLVEELGEVISEFDKHAPDACAAWYYDPARKIR